MNSNKSNNIFFVAFEFPPLGGAGVQRSIKFTKYLSEFGICPIVITAMEKDYENIMPGHPMDYNLIDELDQNIIIERVECKAPHLRTRNKLELWIKSFLSTIESSGKYWEKELCKQLPRLIEKYKPKAIYVSIPPFAMAPLWMKFANKYKIKIIVDFRDAWSQWCVSPNMSRLHYQIKVWQERKILRESDYVVFNTHQSMQDIIKVHSKISTNKFSVIPNGFDEDLLFDDELILTPLNKVIIGYVGSFYYTPESRSQIFTPWWKRPLHRVFQYVPRKEDWLYRSPFYFFKAVRVLLDSDPQLIEKLEIHFAGKIPSWLHEQISYFKLNGICKTMGYLSHNEVIQFQKNCDILLITSSKVLGGRDYSIAGKTYEYFTIGKPILGFVCDGEQKDLLIKSKMSIICDPDKPNENALTLKKILSNKTNLFPDKQVLMKYHRKYLTYKLSEIIKKISG